MTETKLVKVRRRFKMFDLVEEVWTYQAGGGGVLNMLVYRTKAGQYITCRTRKRPVLVKTIAKLEITPELANKTHNVCSVGKSAVDGKWYGWSHRAMVGFGVGDKIFQERYTGGAKLCKSCASRDIDKNCEGLPCPSSIPFNQHGANVIKTDADARKAAVAFARYVS